MRSRWEKRESLGVLLHLPCVTWRTHKNDPSAEKNDRSLVRDFFKSHTLILDSHGVSARLVRLDCYDESRDSRKSLAFLILSPRQKLSSSRVHLDSLALFDVFRYLDNQIRFEGCRLIS